MRKVFEHPAFHEVGLYESILKSHGIPTVIRNEHTSSLVGELPATSSYPELWVVKDDDYDLAISLLQEYSSRPEGVEFQWTCEKCGETVPGNFSTCWNCQSIRSTEQTSTSPQGGPQSPVPSQAPTFPLLTWSCMIIAGLVFVWKFVAAGVAMEILAPNSAKIYGGRWEGLLGCNFMHGDFMHLAFNLYWIWTFGSVLETHVKRGYWLLLFLASAVFSSAAQLAFCGEPGIGLSGVVYGFFGFLWMAKPRYPAFAALLTRQVTMLMLVWLVLCFFLTYAGIFLVANGGHVGGLVAGSLMGWLWVRSRLQAALAGAGLIVLAVASVMYAPWSTSFLVTKARELLDKGETEQAYAMLDRASQAEGMMGAWAAYTSAIAHGNLGDDVGAAKAYETALPKAADRSDFLNNYAWLLATSPDASVRDGKKALQLALKSAELTEWNEVTPLDTLAAAYAENGDFRSAVKWQTQAVEMDPKDEGIQYRLKLYQQGTPFREPPPATKPEK